MRILVLLTDAYGGHGGIAKFNRDLLDALCAHPNVREVVALPRCADSVDGPLPKRLCWVASGAGGKFRYVAKVFQVLLGGGKFDQVICGHLHLLPLAVLAKRRCWCPLTQIIHGVEAWQPGRNRLANRWVRHIDQLVAVSEFTRDRFLEWTQLHGVRSHILPNCIDVAAFGPGPKSDRLLDRHGLRGKLILLTLARLSADERYKGIDEVLRVIPRLTTTFPNVTYLIAGDGTDRTRLEALVATLGLSQRVVFAGRIDESEKADYLRLADAFIMAGWGEGFGIVYLEAMACGVPVVGSNLDGSREALRHGELGILTDPKDPEALLGSIREALGRPHGRVPAGLEWFQVEEFQRRCWKIVNSWATQVNGHRGLAQDSTSAGKPAKQPPWNKRVKD